MEDRDSHEQRKRNVNASRQSSHPGNGMQGAPQRSLNVPGFRPAGIYTAGTAQRLVNMEAICRAKRS